MYSMMHICQLAIDVNCNEAQTWIVEAEAEMIVHLAVS
jgi:hypothetical protein